MIKKINIIILCIFLFSLSYISALSVTTQETIIDVQYNTEKEININLTNNANYSLFSIELVNEYASMSPIDLNQSESRPVTVTFKVNKTGEFSTTLIFKGYREKSCIDIGPTTYQVNINSQNEFSEDDLIICTGDTVSITNKKDETLYYKLVSFSGVQPKIDCDLLVGNCPTLSLNDVYAPTFNIKGFFSFETWYGNLPIEVSNQTILTHNSEDDGSLILNIKCVLESTTLALDYITSDNFSMRYDEVKSGSLVIKNIGNNKAVDIELSSDWIVFTQNNFDLESQSTKSVDFDIYPSISINDDTNKTYEKIIVISSQNSNTINRTIFIFIEYSDIIVGEGDLAYLKYLDEVFCPRHPHSFLCEQSPRIVIKEVPKYNCPKFLAELTAEDILELIKKTLTSTEDAQRVYNLIKQYTSNQNMSLSEILNRVNQSEQNTADTKKEIRDTRTILFILGFGVIFVSLIVGIGYYLYRYYKTKYKVGY